MHKSLFPRSRHFGKCFHLIFLYNVHYSQWRRSGAEFGGRKFFSRTKISEWRFFRIKFPFSRHKFLMTFFMYSVHTFTRIRQHYFSKYWGTNAWTVPHLKFLGNRPPSPPRSPPLITAYNNNSWRPHNPHDSHPIIWGSRPLKPQDWRLWQRHIDYRQRSEKRTVMGQRVEESIRQILKPGGDWEIMQRREKRRQDA